MLLAVFAVQAVAIAAAWLLRARESTLRTRLPYLVSVAVGVLLATALLHLLPESVDALGNTPGVWVTLGMTLLVLFTIERVFEAWTGLVAEPQPEMLTSPLPGHVHGPGCSHLPSQGASLRPVNLLVGSSLHSVVDGTAIATAFAVNPRLGWLTAFAVALHEIPHRMGDVAVLLHLGISPRRTMQYAVIAGVPALLGAAVVLGLGQSIAGAVRWLLPVSAGSFLYIAGVNLLPELQAVNRPRAVALELLLLAVGAALVLAVAALHVG